MRIGLLTTSFPRFEGDVAGHFVLGFARALSQRGHLVRVLAPEPAEPRPRPVFPGLELRWVRYLWPRSAQRTFYGAGVPDNLRKDARAWLGLAPFACAVTAAAFAELSDCDALVSHFALPCGLAAGAARRGRPHLAVLHSADVHLLSRLPGRGALAAQLAARSDALWFVAEDQRARFCACLPEAARAAVRARSHVQPMGIDDDPWQPGARAALRRELGLDRFTLLTIARLVPVKGLREALSALAHRDDLAWAIAGEGPEAARLAELAAGSRLRVRLLGTITGAHKRAWLQAADAFVLPSRVLPSGRSEGVPTALFEAMAAGLPVIASSVGGIPEAVRASRTGLMFDPCAMAPQLEQAVDRLIGGPALRARLSASARVAAGAQRWSALAPRIEALLLGHAPHAAGTGPRA